MLLLYVDLEFSHLKNTLIILLLPWFLSSLSYCAAETTSTVLHTSNEHRRPCHVSDFSGIASKV